MARTFTIATLGGIAIQARMSAGVAFLILFWFLATLALPNQLVTPIGERPSNITLWSLAFISTLSLYFSTIVHELGHALVARARKIEAPTISVNLFGGHANIQEDDQGPLDEFFISISGPLVSLVIAAVTAACIKFIPNQSPPLELFLFALCLLNIWLAIYNLLPAPPLDGGRALRGLLWHFRGDALWATNGAVMVGRVFAFVMASASVVMLLFSSVLMRSELLPPALVADGRIPILGLFLAWMLNNGARSFQRNAVIQQRLVGVTVGRVMSTNPQCVPPWTSLEEIADNHLKGDRAPAVAIVRGDDQLMGLVAYSDVAKVPAKDRPNRTAGEIMTAASALITVSPDDPVEVAIRHMAQRHLNQLPVVADGKLVGMVDRKNIIQLTEPSARRI